KYPNAQKSQLGEVTNDSVTSSSQSVQTLDNAKVNYIRNSVKATVDAYDGTVTMYQWDEKDPILKTWMKVFPKAVRPLSEISADLMSHLRYPEDLFKVQRSMLTKYHVQDPGSFYGGQDFWDVPDDPARVGGQDQPPYYLTLQMPGVSGPEFSLTSTFIPRGSTGSRGVLSAFAAVDANAGDEAGKKRAGYGKIRVLALPAKTVVSAPEVIQNEFNANPAVAAVLTALRLGESQVESGNLLTLPVGGGMLYVQPVYVRGSGSASYPLLQKVLVGFGDKIGFADTLDEALNQVFGGDSGADASDADAKNPDDKDPVASVSPRTELKNALTEAEAAIKQGREALAKQDFKAYGESQTRLKAALDKAIAAEAKVTPEEAATPRPGASGSPATPTPSTPVPA
ncbi:MAG: UPF0182 family protein, partial [Angustibacter sp.]